MNRQDFTEKLRKYFLPNQAEKFADYAEKLHGVARYGALRSMTGFDTSVSGWQKKPARASCG